LGPACFHHDYKWKGWDGQIGGKPQTTNTFVWMVKAVDYTGKPIFQKGTSTLIR
jgi:hypothetical protein